MPVPASPNILFLFSFPWKQIGSWEPLNRNVPVPHYGPSGAVTWVGSGQTPTHFLIHSGPSLALITIRRKGQSRLCWSFRTNPAKHRAIFLKAHLLCLSALSLPFHHCLGALPPGSPSPPPPSLSPLSLLLLIELRSQSKPAMRANWKQVGRKAAKKFQDGRGWGSELFSPGGEKGPCSVSHALYRKRRGDLEATLGLASL